MGYYLINETTLQDVANAIREKDGTNDEIVVSDMPEKIRGIKGSTETTSEKDLILYLWNGFYKYFKEPMVFNGQTIPSRYENLKNTSFADRLIKQHAQMFFDLFDALETKIAEQIDDCTFADIYREMLDVKDSYDTVIKEQLHTALSISISNLSMSLFELQTDVNNIKEDLAGIDTLLTEILGDEVATNE